MITNITTILRKRAVEATSLFVALCALFVTIYQTRSTDYHNKLSLTPMLQFSIVHKEGLYTSISIENFGTGPAIVTQFEVAEKSLSTLTDALIEFAKLNNLDLENLTAKSTSIKARLFVKAGQSIELLKIDLPKKTTREHHGYIEFVKMLPITACYKSLYQDDFYVTTDQNFVGEKSCANENAYYIFGKWIKPRNPFGNEVLQSEAFGI